MKLINKIANILMPIEEEIEESAENTTFTSDEAADNFAGEQTQPGRPESSTVKMNTAPISSARSRLSVRKNKSTDMQILVFKLNSFDEVKSVADELKQKRATLVNYEKVDVETQKRICDFINGVCYVLNGEVKRISSTMVLYVPENITIGNGIVRGADGIFRNDLAS
ncbi:cell division protein SepF [Pectinatus frisingensis]|uniref:cell division protein SepF n=1 Tax=Pectinatus frisingensis TaxID=865 RepID=UPI0018C51323|nr:cell division protein SepF [Pectinatus frisingensis]